MIPPINSINIAIPTFPNHFHEYYVIGLIERGERCLSCRDQELPGFSSSVVRDREAACCFLTLHRLIMEDSTAFEKEEDFLLLLALLIRRYGQPFDEYVPECREEIESVCAFLEAHYSEHISLEQICRHSGLSRSTLLRAFTRSKGVTPYCYLENIRIGAAKKLLEQGTAPVDAALMTGFSDQSHFTNYFSRWRSCFSALWQELSPLFSSVRAC